MWRHVARAIPSTALRGAYIVSEEGWSAPIQALRSDSSDLSFYIIPAFFNTECAPRLEMVFQARVESSKVSVFLSSGT